MFYKKITVKSFPPHNYENGFILKNPSDVCIASNETIRIDLKLMIKVPSSHIGQIFTIPMEEYLIVRPVTLTSKLCKVYIFLTNHKSESILVRRGRAVAFLTCVKCTIVQHCLEIHS